MSAPRGIFLQWEGKRVYRQRIPTPRILEPVGKLSVGKVDDNLIVEGDSLQAMASLKSRYTGAIDVVYIDPPYNLGKDDFRYSDKRFHDPDADDSDAVYVSNEDGGRHTKWLNFMAPRLYMLWDMLSDARGVIFVSINDVELFRLGMLMNEIFGEDNHLGTLVWNGSTDNNPTRVAVEHEYVLCYAKNKANLPAVWTGHLSAGKDLMLAEWERLKKARTPLDKLQKEYRKFVRENAESLGSLVHYVHVDENGPYTGLRAVHNPGKMGHFYDVIHPKTKKACKPPARGYRYPPEAMERMINAKPSQILFGKDHTRIIQLKVYLRDYTPTLKSVINDVDARTGANTLADLFGNREMFRNPKPVELIERLLDFSTTDSSIVLDAFAGSGTTAHAVLNLNKIAGGRRRFILIEEGRGKNGKDRFCRTLTAERVKRCIKEEGYDDGFVFYETGRKLDREAIIGLERDGLANLICQADETGRGRSITRLTGHTYVIGKNPRGEGICLVWKGADQSEVTRADLEAAAKEVTAAALKRPFRIYGTSCKISDSTSWRFCQIPDEIMTQLHIFDTVEELEMEEA
jgi:adenine-specific DNA-methyltransferase